MGQKGIYAVAQIMGRKSVCGMALLLFVLFCACSGNQDQQKLTSRLTQADRVIVLNSRNGLTKTLKGEELARIVRAIGASEKTGAEGLCATPGYTLVFYTAGGVHLATVPTSGVVFWIDKTPYWDKSGAVQSFYVNPGLGLQ
jgi:hypothetical protein